MRPSKNPGAMRKRLLGRPIICSFVLYFSLRDVCPWFLSAWKGRGGNLVKSLMAIWAIWDKIYRWKSDAQSRSDDLCMLRQPQGENMRKNTNNNTFPWWVHGDVVWYTRIWNLELTFEIRFYYCGKVLRRRVYIPADVKAIQRADAYSHT